MKRKSKKKRKKIKIRLNKVTLICIAVIAAVVIAGAVQIHNYFSIAVSDTGDYRIKGVDVSSYQGNIDWDVLADQGIAFAFIKATEGSSHVDKKFSYNWKNAAKTDLRIGAYHFMSFETSGNKQAANFIKNVKSTGNMLPPVIDVEFYGSFESKHPSKEVIYNTLETMMDALEEEYGKKPVIYTTTYIYETYLAGRYDNDIWISDPEMAQPLIDGTKWTFCQYSFEGVMKGYSGNLKHIDLDVFNGSRMDFFRYD